MRYLLWCGLCLIYLNACSCNNNGDNSNSSQTYAANGETGNRKNVDMNAFRTYFQQASLPLVLPEEQGKQTGTEIKKEEIEALFGGQGFKPAFGSEKDVNDLAENLETSAYYPTGVLKAERFSAYIIRKAEEGSLYYLCTLDSAGNFIDGMCIAFTIGTETDNTTRTASINEDMSLIIGQEEVVKGKSNDTGNKVFYEITPEGEIRGIDLDATATQPAQSFLTATQQADTYIL